MPRRPDFWTRLVSRFVRSNLDEQERRTEDVIAHAEQVRDDAERILESDRRVRREYKAAERRFRRAH